MIGCYSKVYCSRGYCCADMSKFPIYGTNVILSVKDLGGHGRNVNLILVQSQHYNY